MERRKHFEYINFRLNAPTLTLKKETEVLYNKIEIVLFGTDPKQSPSSIFYPLPHFLLRGKIADQVMPFFANSSLKKKASCQPNLF